VMTALLEQGWTINANYANFIWIRLGDFTSEFAALCESEGITIRPFPGEGVRVTIAEPAASDRFIALAQRFWNDHFALR